MSPTTRAGLSFVTGSKADVTLSSHPYITAVQTLTTWRAVLDKVDELIGLAWVFRGQDAASSLKTSLDREFRARGASLEREIYWRFVRMAPRLLSSSHLVPTQLDAAAWVGLIQHYGGPTRMLDVTRSPFVALYFAFEPPGSAKRALWAVDSSWCANGCAHIMSAAEGISFDRALGRTRDLQAQLVSSLILGSDPNDPEFASFKPFSGILPVDPWNPDPRQSAQQAMFLCVANPAQSFIHNAAAHPPTGSPVMHRFEMPASLREEALEQLSFMNVTAATLFPDLGGLARSLRTYPVRRARTIGSSP